MKKWTEKEFSQWVYYDAETGLIVGSVYKIGNQTGIWGGRVYQPHESVLGQYIDSDFARKAVETYWDIQDRTLLEQ